MKTIEFTKAVASGNDFIIIDTMNAKSGFSLKTVSRLAETLCERKNSIGSDGILLIERSKKCDFKMRIINPDGTEVQMCGNGARCVVLYAHRFGITKKKTITVETKAGVLKAELKGNIVKVRLSEPKDMRLNFDLDIDGALCKANFINTGVPHVVCFVENIEECNVDSAGRYIRYHPEFQPQGTNANFVEVIDRAHIKVRTYERGVEAETLACGTGSVASSIITAFDMQKETKANRHKIKVTTTGGEHLTVYFSTKNHLVGDVYLEGLAHIVYTGKVFI